MSRESIMGHAKRKSSAPAVRAAVPTVDGTPLHDSAVEHILDIRLGGDDGDPVAGIRNALVASTAFWTLLALAYIAFR